MRILSDIGLFASGIAIALVSVSIARVAPGAWGVIQFPIVALVFSVFFMKEEKTPVIAAGIGTGLDLVSSYPFFAWTVVVGGTAFVGWWFSKNVLTNRSLPSLMVLAAAMRASYFVFELAVSRLSVLAGGTVWYRLGLANLPNVVFAFAIEMAILAVCFVAYVRLRGEQSRMLTHIM